jgi:Flp pilus assembly pilin Flp
MEEPYRERLMPNWFGPVRGVMRSESGSSSVQHAVVLSLVVAVSIGGVQTFGTVVQNYFQESDSSFSLIGEDGGGSSGSNRSLGRRLSQKVPVISLQERLRVAEERKAQRIAELRERASRRQH